MSDVAIKVDTVSKTFKLPHEKQGTIKNIFINIFRRNKTYEKQKVLSNISFEVKKGEFFGIVGRNGSGKSTLLKLLAEIYTPDKGSITINGQLTPFIELGVGFNHELTGRENVFLNGALLGFNRREMNGMYEDIVAFAELEKFMDQKLKNYSSGMQVRLAFSIAIRARSDILLLDEVLAVGDAAFQQKCFDYFEELKREHKTVVFVSHDMGAIRRFCNKAIYIDQGKLTFEGEPQGVADAYLVDNVKNMQSNELDQTNVSDTHKLNIKLLKQTKDELTFESDYTSSDEHDMYIAISVINDGQSIAEITTPENMMLTGSGRVTYTLDTRILNGGIYQITAALSRKQGRKLLNVAKQKINFVVKGDDATRGGAIKLKDSWELHKTS